MSEEKKALGGKSCSESLQAQHAARDLKDPSSSKAPQSDGRGKRLGRTRARNQDVLPGILGKQLKAAYSELLNAPVPDAITQLIKELERNEPRPQKADEPEEGGQ
jgi:Anti-sigma factor NepR